MKTRICCGNALAFVVGLLMTYATSALSQVTVSSLGSKWTVVQYDTGSSNKLYNAGFLYNIGRKDGFVKTDAPKSINDIFRTGFEFNLHGMGIMRGSTISSATLLVTVGGSTYNARIRALDSLQNMSNPTNLWDAIGNSQTTYFSNIPYGSNLREYASDPLKQAVANHVYNGTFKIAIMSQTENQNDTHTTAEVSLRVTYTLPPGKITVTNSFGGGNVKVHGTPNWIAPAQFTWQAGSQNPLEALDQEWPIGSGKQRTFDPAFDKGWHKIVGTGRTVESTSRFFTYTVMVGETATLEAQFKTSLTVSGTLTIASGTTYPIERGTTVNCLPGSKIVVNGSLQAVGTEDAPIVFTSPTGEYWQGIEFNGDGGSANGSALLYCTVKYASTPIKATNKPNLLLYRTTISNSNFSNGTDDAAMAFYNSSPQITAVTVSGQGNSSNGARFAARSRGSMNLSTIRQCGAGNGIVIQGASYPRITDCNIDSNYYHGILAVYNGVQSNGPNNPYIFGNNVRRNGFAYGIKYYIGIDIHASSAILRFNNVQSSNYGIFCAEGGFIWTEEVNSGWWDLGANVVTGNSYGMFAYNGSTAFFGRAWEQYGDIYFYGACNKLYGNDQYDALATYGSVAYVQGNWWGQYPPNYSKIYNYQSSIYYDYPRQWVDYCDPIWGGGGGGLVSTPTPGQPQTPTDDELEQGLRAFASKNFQAAKILYLSGLSKASNSERRIRAISGLYHLQASSKDPTIVSLLSNFSRGSSEEAYFATRLVSRMHISSGNIDQAVSILRGLKERAVGTENEKQALLELAGLRGYSAQYANVASDALTELKAKFGSSLDGGIMAALGGPGAATSKPTSQVTSEQPGDDLTSFPNPFNPSTIIQYRLAKDGMVSVKVYDVIGREVASLVSEVKSAGTYTVTWDASRMPSGIYFTRLETAGKALVKKLMLVK